ncbi:aminoglycoside phosphotransferase family protein [Kribbella sp. NBC_00382]|uniref:aminoglycoside phosphotransferase family protein n=1 Tax=Kribbella sp. NBC_00382 TaxID=2975967 RepID=UPI002E1F2F58
MTRVPAGEEVEEVIEFINEAHGSSYQLVQRLAGGNQSGAYLVRAPDHRQAVLKWSERTAWAGQVLRAAPRIPLIRERGYPTPAWLAVGVTSDGFPYQLQEFLPGKPMADLGEAEAVLLINLVNRQTGLDPDPGRNWSEYARSVVFGETAPARDRLRASSPTGAAVVEAFLRLCHGLENLELPSGDLVHGDLSTNNVLVQDGRVTGVVDIEALGSGTRVFDLASLLREGYLWRGDPSALATIRTEAERIAGPDVLKICVSSTVFEVLDFERARSSPDLDQMLTRALRLAADLAS